MANKYNILISGSLAYDRIMDFPGYFKDHIMPDKIHMLNVSFLISSLKESYGGTAGNIAYNLNLLEEKSTILTTVGKDFSEYGAWLKKLKVDISQIKIIKGNHTASAYIITDKSDNQINAFNPGAMALPRGQFDSKLLKAKNTWAIVSPGNAQDMLDYSLLYKKSKIKHIFDPGQQIPNLSKKTLSSCITGAEILIGNDYEIELIKKKIGWTMDGLIDKVNMLIITKGEKGSEIYQGKNKIIVPAVKVKKVLDPTGAGDAYRAGLIKGLVENWDIEKAARLASEIAACAVSSFGTQNHTFSLGEVCKKI